MPDPGITELGGTLRAVRCSIFATFPFGRMVWHGLNRRCHDRECVVLDDWVGEERLTHAIDLGSGGVFIDSFQGDFEIFPHPYAVDSIEMQLMQGIQDSVALRIDDCCFEGDMDASKPGGRRGCGMCRHRSHVPFANYVLLLMTTAI